jgi:MFS family permease
VRSAHALDARSFGIILLITPLTGFGLLSLSSLITTKISRRWLGSLGLLCSLAGSCGVALAPDFALLIGARILCGLGYGFTDAAVISSALAWERSQSKPLLGRIYASFGVGAIGGALSGGWLLSINWHFSAVLLLQLPIGLLLLLGVLISPSQANTSTAQQPTALRLPWRHAHIRALVLLSLGGALAEALTTGWLVIHLHHLGSGPFFASAAYAASEISLIVGRMSTPYIQRRLGIQRTLLTAAVLLLCGAALLSSSHPFTSAAAFAVIGLGIAALTPLTLSLSQQIMPHAGDQITRLLLAVGYLGFIVAGPLGGLLVGYLQTTTMLIVSLSSIALLIAGLSGTGSLRTQEALGGGEGTAQVLAHHTSRQQ